MVENNKVLLGEIDSLKNLLDSLRICLSVEDQWAQLSLEVYY